MEHQYSETEAIPEPTAIPATTPTTEPAARATKPKKNVNRIIALVLIVVAAGTCLALYAFGFFSQADKAVVLDGEGNEYNLPLNKNTELEVTTSLGTNIVVVQDGAVCIREADCPNQDCVEQGAISAAGEQIICLPHQLTVTIVSETSEAEFDTVSS